IFMKLLFDIFPVIVFVIAYYLYDLYTATAILIVTSILQVVFYRIRHHKFETLHLITLAVVIPLGSATLLLHNEMFIKWKPTVIYWLFSGVFLFSQFVGEK